MAVNCNETDGCLEDIKIKSSNYFAMSGVWHNRIFICCAGPWIKKKRPDALLAGVRRKHKYGL